MSSAQTPAPDGDRWAPCPRASLRGDTAQYRILVMEHHKDETYEYK